MVKCTGCGLMGRRDSAEFVVEALPAYRANPSLAPSFPVCIMGERSFRAEYSAGLDDQPSPAAEISGIPAVWLLHEIIEKEHDCPSFQPYKEGIMPKEHREMLDRQWMQERERQRRTDDRRWHLWEFVAGALVLVAATVVGAFISQDSGTEGPAVAVVATVQAPAQTVVLRKGQAFGSDFCVTYRVGDLEQPLIICAPVADHPCFSSAIIGDALPRACNELGG